MKIVIKKSARSERDLFEKLKRRFFDLKLDTLNSVGVIHSGNAEDIANRLREHEINLVEELVSGLADVPKHPNRFEFPMCQSGDTCVPMSVSNALLVLDQESFYGRDRGDQIAATNHFIDHFLAMEPGHDRSERRSLDRVHHYFENNFHRRVGLQAKYNFTLSGSLLDMIFQLYLGEASILVVAQAHCLMAFSLWLYEGYPVIDMKDPLVSGTKTLGLEDFAKKYVWSTLGGLPYAVSVGATYTAETALDLIEAQAERKNLGVCCHSGILSRQL
ncbi:MAG: hypothetical protein P1V97_01085 [Planctomycetota bacterium]|nr:hypothetical protein [Planctomycetota bacterium]